MGAVQHLVTGDLQIVIALNSIYCTGSVLLYMGCFYPELEVRKWM